MTNINPSFSIIIPTYKRFDNLFECLNCLSFYFEPDNQVQLGVAIQVIVSDDAQDPELQALLLKRFPWCIYTPGPSRGPSANRNNGARVASYQWLVFTDDDCLPQPGWIETYASAVDKCDVMEGRTSAAGRRTRMDEECPINEVGGFLWSCNFAIKRVLFLQMAGFNEDFPAAAMEDVELNARVNYACLRRMFLTNAVVLHPWRLRKGRSYVRVHSLSVAKYVCLHPEAADRFSLVSQLKKILRSFKQNIGYAITEGISSGLFRQIFLDFYSSILAWIAVRRIR
jgi:GT2 family glycosyltransferase